MFGNVLSVVKSNSLFSAETKKVQFNARGNKDGFVDKMYKLWAEAHANQPVSEVETRDGIALYGNGKTVSENEPPIVVDSVQPLIKPSIELKSKPATAPPYGIRILLALLAVAIIASIVSPKSHVPVDQTTEAKINSPVSLKESDEQIRAENDEALNSLRKPPSISSHVPVPAATLRPKESDEQIRAENNKILDALPKTKHHRAG